MDIHSIIALCRNFHYEKFESGSTIVKQKDLSNNKFYVILKGEAVVIVNNDKLGQFGDMDKDEKKEPELDCSIMQGVFLHKARQWKPRGKTTIQTEQNTSPKLSIRRSSKHLSLNISSPNNKKLSVSKFSPAQAYQKSLFGPRSSRDATSALNSIKRSSKRESLVKVPTDDSVDPTKELEKVGADNKEQLSPIIKRVRLLSEEIGSAAAVNKRLRRVSGEVRDSKSVGLASLLSSLDNLESERNSEDNLSDSSRRGLDTEEEEEKSEFEKNAAEYGKIVRVIQEGEGFGEVALKRNIPRTATIMCKTDCELLILRKEEYDLGFGRMQREKEEFLNMVFPMLKTNISSTHNYDYLLYSFRVRIIVVL